MMDSPYDEGWDGYYNDLEPKDCPYKEKSSAYEEWMDGYEAASEGSD